MRKEKFAVCRDGRRRTKRAHILFLSFLFIYYYLIRELYIFNSFHFEILRKAKRYVKARCPAAANRLDEALRCFAN